MIGKRSLLLILYLAITGCNMDCVEPGLQSRNTSVNVDIPVREADKGAIIHWVDSGQVISNGETIKFTLGGSINFCPPTEGENPRKVLVPAVFCADGSIPSYSDEFIDNSGLDEQEVCRGIGFGNRESHSWRRYVDTGIKVDPGDKLRFSLVPREITIDYDNPGRKGTSFDDNCYRTETGDEKVLASEILNIDEQEGKEFFCEGKDGKRNKVKFLPLKKTKANKSTVLVGNGYTPYDNKVHFNVGYIDKQKEKPWANGALLDLRRAKIGLNELCDGKNCDPNEVRKYSSYELNCYYQNICYTEKGIWNYGLGQAGEQNCVSSIRYKKYDKKNTCDMYSYLNANVNEKGDDQAKALVAKINANSDEENKSWAEALVAKISDPGDASIPEGKREDMKGTAKGTQCLPEEKGARGDNVCSQITGDFKDFSLELNHDYEVGKVGNVMLAIADYGHYGANRGGYHVEVTRSCNFDSDKNLYMYLGDNPPGNPSVPDNDFKKVENLDKITEDNVKYYIIDGSRLEKNKSKKIYFGIDVSNVEKEDITDKDGKYYEDNKYIVTLFVKKKINDFISSNVNRVFDFIKKEVVGNSVKDLYKGYAKGLLQGVRALLTLYVIFTVVGYMLGTAQPSKFDFIVRMMKIAFIAFALSDRSWELFGQHLSYFFVDGSTYLVDSFSGYIGEGNKRFAFLDLTAGVLFTGETWLKFLSLMFAGPFGFIAFLIILHASFMFLKCIISATFRYVISTILVAFLLSLTPLFIVFILFQQTKPLFDGWIKTLAHIAVQPVILFSSLSILNQLMYSVLYNLTNFSACYQCLISINFLSNDFCLMKSILPLGYSPGTSVDVALSDGAKTGGHFAALPIDLIQAFIYLIIASAMEVFVDASQAMAQAIFSSGIKVAGSVSQVASTASQSILSTFGLDDDTQRKIKQIREAAPKDSVKTEVRLPQSKEGKDGQSHAQKAGKSDEGEGGTKKGQSKKPLTLEGGQNRSDIKEGGSTPSISDDGEQPQDKKEGKEGDI
ncbi:MAG: type IV secretion system protein [Wolbachia sp.]